jgi:hypothetical protein
MIADAARITTYVPCSRAMNGPAFELVSAGMRPIVCNGCLVAGQQLAKLLFI